MIVVARTDAEAGHKGISLLVVERGMDGFERGRNLEKMGLKAQDTAELFFDNVVVPKENLLGEEGSGFISLMMNLPQERLSIAMIAAAACEHILELSLSYAKEREAFGKPIGKFQHNRFLIAEMATEARIARVFVDDCVRLHNEGKCDVVAGRDGEVVDDRAADQARRPGRPAARRLRLHDGVPGRPRLRRQPDPDDLRRHDRDPEGDHRPVPRHLTWSCVPRRPPGRRRTHDLHGGQAVIEVWSLEEPVLISTLRGFAFSATGIRSRSTPLS